MTEALRKIKKLTDAQIARFPEFVERWTAIGLSTEPADRRRAEAAIRLIYKCGGKKPPARIVWCGSPLSQAITRAVVLDKKIGDSVEASVRDSVRASVRASAGASVWYSVWDSVGASVWNSVGASVWESVRATVWNSVEDSVRASVGASVWNSVGGSVWNSVGASAYGQHDATWLAFYSYFREVCGLQPQTEKLVGWMELAQSAGWVIPHENVCFASERHNILRRDDRGRLHCETGPACAYPDGFAIHAWHGVRVPADWVENKKKLTPQTALRWANIEQRRVACEIVGWDNILRELNARSIDRDVDPQIGELVEVDLPENGPQRFLRVLCATGRRFALPVPITMQTALEANAATYGISKDIFNPEVRT